MILIQLYKVIDYNVGHYVVELYKNVYDVEPVKVNISRWKFREWKEGKLDKSELEGEKVQLHKIRNKKSNVIKNTPPIISISDKEKEIMDYVYKIISNNTYAIEKDIEIDRCSKALVQRTVRNEDILDVYKLERVRANKEIKRDLKMDIEGYPFILCKKIGK